MCGKKTKDTALNGRPKESWNYTQTARQVKLWTKTFILWNQAVVMKFSLQLENN